MMNGQQSQQQQQSVNLHFASLQQQSQQLHSLTQVSSAQQQQQQPPYILQPSGNYLEAFGTSNGGPGNPRATLIVASSMPSSSGLPTNDGTGPNYPNLPNVQIYPHTQDTTPQEKACHDGVQQSIHQLHQDSGPLLLQMQQQYEAQIQSLQQELATLRATVLGTPSLAQASSSATESTSTTLATTVPTVTLKKAANSKRSQATASNGGSTVVETYCENIQSKEFTCRNCSYKTKSEGSLFVHNTNHLVNQRYLHLPTTVFSVRPSVRDTSSYVYPCGECSGKYTQADLYLHIYQHHTGESPFHCDECDLFFTHFEFLDDHQRSTHMKNPTKKRSRSVSQATLANSEANGNALNSVPQLTYYSVVKNSKPFSVLHSISRSLEDGGVGGGSVSGSGSLNAWCPESLNTEIPTYRGGYHHSSGPKRGRARGGCVSVAPHPNGEIEESIFKCHFEECFFEADSKDRLDFHLFAHRSSRFKCPYCPYVSNVLNDIKRHVTRQGGKHEGMSMFRCSCDFATNCDKAFREHCRSAHFGKSVDDKSLNSYIEELFHNMATDPAADNGAKQ